jgi:PEP-CTERM/exosortase A-associated glycosyltransferase
MARSLSHLSCAAEWTRGRLPGDLRILHVLDHSLPLHSGYSFRTIALLREQRRRGWHTAHLTTPKHTLAGPPAETVEGFLFHRTPPLPGHLDRPVLGEIALIRAVSRRIAEIAAQERPHILHAHSPVLNALACIRAARRLKLPVVYEVRAFWEDAAVANGTTKEGSLRYRATHALETYVLRHADAIAPICEGLRRDILTRGVPAAHITGIPNGVDIDEFPFRVSAQSALRASLALEGAIVLGFLGSFYAYEGLDLLLAALPAIRRQEKIVALLVGGGPTEGALKAQAERLQVGDAVRLVGRVPHDEVHSYYDLVDIFVYPRHRSRLTETVTPLKPLEAMARGGIVLASDVGGHRELIREGKTGYLFPAGNVHALSSAVLRVVADREGWPALRQSARRFVEEERSWSATTAGYAALYAGAFARARE